MLSHRQVNNILTLIVIVVGIYIVITPLFPEATFWWQKTQGFHMQSYNSLRSNVIPRENRLIIPSIGIDEVILENQKTFNKNGSILLLPDSSTPDKIGNSVIIGHRFSHLPHISTPFYHLDKVQKGQKIYTTWNQKLYTFTVAEIKIVPPSDTTIEAPSNERKLTLYTCTPLLTATDRLVITATPDKEPR